MSGSGQDSNMNTTGGQDLESVFQEATETGLEDVK